MVVPEPQALVIISGSSGFIGGAVCRAFVSDGYSVVGFDRPHVLEPQPGVTNVPFDVTEEDSVAQAVGSVLRDFAEPFLIQGEGSDAARSVRLGRIFGIEIGFHFSWFVIRAQILRLVAARQELSM